LLASQGLEGLAQDEVTARAAAGELEVRDGPAYRACFSDLDEQGSRSLAAYVLGLLAAAHDDLRYETIADRAYATTPSGVRIVMVRDERGSYRIALHESVPEEVRERLLGLQAPISPTSSHRPR
jgi:hypothetical protein